MIELHKFKHKHRITIKEFICLAAMFLFKTVGVTTLIPQKQRITIKEFICLAAIFLFKTVGVTTLIPQKQK